MGVPASPSAVPAFAIRSFFRSFQSLQNFGLPLPNAFARKTKQSQKQTDLSASNLSAGWTGRCLHIQKAKIVRNGEKMRNKYEEQLEKLNTSIQSMGKMVEVAIESTILTLMGRDKDAAKTVKANDYVIDDMERDIETQCLKLLLQQQPVAGDLRMITSALKMITDMERIGDHAVDIADLVLDLPDLKYKKMATLEEMTSQTLKMIQDGISSYIEHDYNKAKNVIANDDQVDVLYHEIKKDLIDKIKKTDEGEKILDYLLIAKYIERIGDHAVNIAKWVVFGITGLRT